MGGSLDVRKTLAFRLLVLILWGFGIAVKYDGTEPRAII
jgi:hypothetical protein